MTQDPPVAAAEAQRLQCRAMLLDEVVYHARWHAEQSRHALTQHAHARAALVMEELHTQLLALPADHADWKRYAQEWAGMRELEGLACGEAQRALLRGYGFDVPTVGGAGDFLQALLGRLATARTRPVQRSPERLQ